MNKTYLLQTPRLGLRNWLETDLEPFAQLNADAEVRKYFPGLLTREESDQLVQRLMDHAEKYGYTFWAVDELISGEFVGMLGLIKTDMPGLNLPEIETGWRFKRSAWGKGYATEAAKACLQYAFEKLQAPEVCAFTSIHNFPSENVMKKAGMLRRFEFDHPKLESDSWLLRHVLYSVKKEEFSY